MCICHDGILVASNPTEEMATLLLQRQHLLTPNLGGKPREAFMLREGQHCMSPVETLRGLVIHILSPPSPLCSSLF